MIEVHNVTAGYGKTKVLQDITMTIQPGKISALIGCNGCGKSTLLKTLVKLLPISSGTILLNGAPLCSMSAGARANHIAYLPQGGLPPSDITVARMVLYGRFPHLHYPKQYRPQDEQIAAQAMETMGISALADRPLTSLSGGMRQKVSLAMALAQQTPILVMDEPTTYLDISQQLRFMQMMQAQAKQGKTVLLVLHDILLAAQYTDELFVMQDGKLIKNGTPESIVSSDVLQSVMGVTIRSINTEDGVQYYYTKTI